MAERVIFTDEKIYVTQVPRHPKIYRLFYRERPVIPNHNVVYRLGFIDGSSGAIFPPNLLDLLDTIEQTNWRRVNIDPVAQGILQIARNQNKRT